MTRDIVTRTVAGIDRLPNSRNGNPRFSLTFTDGTTLRTKTDGTVGYEITPSRLPGRTVVLTVTTGARPVVTDLEMI